MTIEERLSSEFGLRQDYTKNIIELIDEEIQSLSSLVIERKCMDHVMTKF